MCFKRQQDFAMPLARFGHVSRRGTVFSRGCSRSVTCRATAHCKPDLASQGGKTRAFTLIELLVRTTC